MQYLLEYEAHYDHSPTEVKCMQYFRLVQDMTYINKNTEALGYNKLSHLQGQLMICKLALKNPKSTLSSQTSL